MVTTLDAHAEVLTANDRLKEGFEAKLAVALVTATVVHLGVFALWPAMGVADWRDTPTTIVDLVPPETVELPPAPEPLARPMSPVASADVTPDATIDVVPFARDEIELPPPRPVTEDETVGESIPFVPFDVPPSIANAGEVTRILERTYPTLLRDAGIHGKVVLLVHIDETGKILEARIGTSSGVAGLDEAALRAVSAFKFRPAKNRDLPVAVWTSVPVTYEVKR